MPSFREYCLSLDESLNTPYPWKTTTASRRSGYSYDAVFTVPAVKASPSVKASLPLQYSVHIYQDRGESILGTDDHPWEFTFAMLGDREALKGDGDSTMDFDVTHTGHAFNIFATVIDIMKTFINKHHPTVISFSASEPSRTKLYDRFIKMVSAAVPGYRGYKLTTAMSRANGYGTDGPYWLTPNHYVIVSSKVSLKLS